MSSAERPKTQSEADWEAYNDKQNREAERIWNAKHGKARRTGQEIITVEAVQAPQTVPGTALAHPLEVDPAAFKTALTLRTTNRQTLVQWLRDALKRGQDFDALHVISKKKCDQGRNCKVDWHWSKDQLFKPGAEKICGMLGVTPTFPNMAKYEEAAVNGIDIRSVIIHCHITAIDGHVIADGVGAASLSDTVDLNKALKMACKSAHIDATLRMAGLSEIFCPADTKPEPKTPEQPRVSIGKHEGELWADVDIAYVRATIDNKKAPPSFRKEAQAELDRRPKEFDFDDSERL